MSAQAPRAYPPPAENPNCRCYPTLDRAFFCHTGHTLECHYPYGCKEAGCGHLLRYDFSIEETAELRRQAEERMRAAGDPFGYLDTPQEAST